MSTKKHTLRVYPSRKVKGQWGWSLIAPNGKKIATCGELYRSKAHAVKMANNLWYRFSAAELVVGAPKKAPAKFKAGMQVKVNHELWKDAIGTIKRRGLRAKTWVLHSVAMPGYRTYSDITIAEEHLKKAKRVTKKITNPVN